MRVDRSKRQAELSHEPDRVVRASCQERRRASLPVRRAENVPPKRSMYMLRSPQIR